MRIAVISEEITIRPAEGLLVFLMHMCRYLSGRHDLLVLHARGNPDPDLDARRVLKGRTLFSRELKGALESWKPDLLIYTPASGLTGFGMLRSVLLKRMSGRPAIVVALQARETGKTHRALSLWSAPELVLSPVREMRQALEELRVNTDFIMPGYDPKLFKPVDTETKLRLRERYGIPVDRFVVLHVGHVKESRNLQALLRYRDWGADIQPVVKAGEVEPVWRNHLRQAGIIVIDEYIDDIHEIYQAADLYFFPVSIRTGALEFPLSVIEACACNLPVLTTRFGALPEVLEKGNGLEWFSGVAEIPDKIKMLRNGKTDTHTKVTELSWERMFDRYLTPHLESLVSLSTEGGEN
ncbi:MAG: glycosyltransferase family 4 protein [Candidatus Krumholzibacteria bacterium]|nr:glycosyltransferase family 4 protein [Candidatus Krumholzibacteria bacterium]